MLRAALPRAAILLTAALWGPAASAGILTGADAYGDYTKDAPGIRRHIVPADLPAPYATQSVPNMSSLVDQPAGAAPLVPEGFKVEPFAQLKRPRVIRLAPNGDLLLAQTRSDQVSVLRAADGPPKASGTEIFAAHLNSPFGIAFYPAGPDPHYVYIANEDSVVRFPYKSGDMKASGPAEVIVPRLPAGGGHTTRDIAFSPDGTKLYISVGSSSNVSADQADAKDIEGAEKERGLGASMGDEAWRADVLVTSPDGKAGLKSYANGIRNCAGLTVEPRTGDVWCATNERDALGDNLPPDYATRIKPGAFYGWPLY